jgi:hypothetical protein
VLIVDTLMIYKGITLSRSLVDTLMIYKGYN